MFWVGGWKHAAPWRPIRHFKSPASRFGFAAHNGCDTRTRGIESDPTQNSTLSKYAEPQIAHHTDEADDTPSSANDVASPPHSSERGGDHSSNDTRTRNGNHAMKATLNIFPRRGSTRAKFCRKFVLPGVFSCLWGLMMVAVHAQTPGTVLAWGSNANGQTSVPVGLSGVKAIVAGQNFCLALKTDGTVVAWGSNSANQVSGAAAQSGVKAVAAGHQHAVALKNDGTVVAWGWNNAGQTDVPVGLSGVVAISAGSSSSMALNKVTIERLHSVRIPTAKPEYFLSCHQTLK